MRPRLINVLILSVATVLGGFLFLFMTGYLQLEISATSEPPIPPAQKVAADQEQVAGFDYDE